MHLHIKVFKLGTFKHLGMSMKSNLTTAMIGKISPLIPKDENLILFYDYGRIGDNPLYLFKEMVKLGYSEDYTLLWIVSNNKYAKLIVDNGGAAVIESNKGELLKYILKAKYYVTSTGPPLWKSSTQILISLWHGIPLKQLPRHFSSFGKRIDYLVTTSEFACLLLGFPFQLPPEKCHPLGQPRCDALFTPTEKSINILSQLLRINPKGYTEILMYLPTFRDYNSGITFQMTLGLINNPEFRDYVSQNNLLFLVKPHPRDEKLFEKYESEYIKVIKNNDLLSRFLTLYDLLPAIDVLVTDYSSVYFDYLLLNRPIVFYVPDLEKYRETRGFLLEPYEKWTPGDKARTVEELIWALEEAINNPKKWERERIWLRDVMFKYQDGKSSERIIKYFWGDV